MGPGFLTVSVSDHSRSGVFLRVCHFLWCTIPIREIEINSPEVLFQETRPIRVGALLRKDDQRWRIYGTLARRSRYVVYLALTSGSDFYRPSANDLSMCVLQSNRISVSRPGATRGSS